MLALAMPAFADEDPSDLCKHLVALADAGSSRFQQARIIWKSDDAKPTCNAVGRAALGLCRWFDAHRDSLAPIGLTQDALDCLGHEREPNFEPAPDEVPGHAWWSRGTFRPESPTLAREHAAVTMDMNVGYDTPRYVIFTARPK